jgi:hypothetical protein
MSALLDQLELLTGQISNMRAFFDRSININESPRRKRRGIISTTQL